MLKSYLNRFLIGGSYVTAKRVNHNGTPKHSIGGVSTKYRRMAEIYRHFGREWCHVLDFSDQALIDHFNHVSFGTTLDKSKNGFYHGEKWADVNVAMWLEDRSKGDLVLHDLYSDPDLPDWWLDKVL